MAELRDTRVFRGGATASELKHETNSCWFGASSSGLVFRFSIASKGGGRTEISLQVGAADIPAIVSSIACAMPDGDVVLLRALMASQAQRSAELKAIAATLDEGLDGIRATWASISRELRDPESTLYEDLDGGLHELDVALENYVDDTAEELQRIERLAEQRLLDS